MHWLQLKSYLGWLDAQGSPPSGLGAISALLRRLGFRQGVPTSLVILSSQCLQEGRPPSRCGTGCPWHSRASPAQQFPCRHAACQGGRQASSSSLIYHQPAHQRAGDKGIEVRKSGGWVRQQLHTGLNNNRSPCASPNPACPEQTPASKSPFLSRSPALLPRARAACNNINYLGCLGLRLHLCLGYFQ